MSGLKIVVEDVVWRPGHDPPAYTALLRLLFEPESVEGHRLQSGDPPSKTQPNTQSEDNDAQQQLYPPELPR